MVIERADRASAIREEGSDRCWDVVPGGCEQALVTNGSGGPGVR